MYTGAVLMDVCSIKLAAATHRCVTLMCMQVLDAAAARQKDAEAAQLALEQQRAAQHAQLKAALDQQAQGIKKQQEDSKKELAAVLAQQIRDKQCSSQQLAQGLGGALLINPPDPAAVTSQRQQRQAEYRQVGYVQ
jgi:hypothetical protein